MKENKIFDDEDEKISLFFFLSTLHVSFLFSFGSSY